MVDLPAPDRPVNHRMQAVWLLRLAREALPISSACQWMFSRAAQREIDEPRADRVVGHAVDQDEAAHLLVVRIGIEGDGLIEIDIADADLVELELLGRQMLERIDIDLVFRMARARPARSWCRPSADRARPGSIGSSLIQMMVDSN